MSAELELDLRTARRLSVVAQGLAGPRRPASRDGIMAVFERIGRVQVDPTAAVAPSHQLVLWSRLGPYPLEDLDRLLWQERRLFWYSAFIFRASDYPLLAAQMRWFPRMEGPSRAARIRRWMADNAELRSHILDELDLRGPLPSGAFEDRSSAGWASSGWTDARNVTQMLEWLATAGEIAVAGRAGGQRLWDRIERCLPADVSREPLADEAALRARAERILRWHGLLSRRELEARTLPDRQAVSPVPELVGEGRLVPVRLLGDGGRPMRGPHLVHADAVSVIESLRGGDWQPRTTLISPFDLLIKDRKRTELLFGFRYKMEIYVPAAKREYGYYVMPILHGDRLIGRIDPFMDRGAGVLRVRSVHAEPEAPAEAAAAIGGALDELASFLGAREVTFEGRMPAAWRSLAS